MHRTLLCAAVAALLTLPAAATRAEPAPHTPELDDIIVTATRTAVTADANLAPVSVITRQDIERLQARSLHDLLRGLPGVTVSSNGGAGKQTSLFLRGTESDHLLVLIDGVRVGSATTGSVAFQDLPLEQIERIEIVRGPRSSLYGSDALGGVIQIFTRRGAGQGLNASFSATLGSYATREATAGIGFNGTAGWLNATLAHADTDGFNSCRGQATPGAGCFADQPDNDPYRNSSLTLNGGWRFGEAGDLQAHALRAEGRNTYDGSFVDESHYREQAVGAKLRLQAHERLVLSASAGQSQDYSDNFGAGVFKTRFDTQRDSYSLQGDIGLAQQQLLSIGADYANDEVDSTTAYVERSRRVTGVFAQYQGQAGAHDIEASLRNDDNEQFGTHTTGGLAWGYALSEGLRLIANYGTAFKAPTFNELYFPGFGNANLKPEESRSAEIGLRGMTQAGRWELHAFHTRVDELIAFDAATFAPGNIDQARIRGLEASWATDIAGWAVDSSLTLLDPRNDSQGANNGNYLPRRARQSARVDLDRRYGAFAVGTTVDVQGERYDDLGNRRRLGGYATLDLRAEYAVTPEWLVQARVANLTDRNYETAAFYNQAGRSYYLTLRYRPDH
ncbi:MAG: TonB-dependent vitamin B12 receptor [Rhodanobacteraceae bacterium]|nr:TonB-dependent vitamin B12 receptor [Rhodanobacteraceae bacterium]